MSRRRALILIIVGLVIIVPLIILGISLQNEKNDGVVRDRDTGEMFDKNENNVRTGGSGAGEGAAVLFGMEPLAERLLDAGLKTGSLDSLKEALWKYGEARLDNEYQSLTLRPQDLSVGTSKITGNVRLGQTDTIIPVTILPSTTGEAAIVTLNQDGSDHGGTYVYVGGIDSPENLLFTISQTNDRSTDLTIQAYDGYRETALDYIDRIGYEVPAFTITFTNYETPFK